jgi:hypothetical protein
MRQIQVLSNLALWLAAIAASVVTGASAFLSFVLLPCLVAVSVAVTWQGSKNIKPAV